MASHAHLPRPHLPHPDVHVPRPHAEFDEHPWRMLPAALTTVALLTALLIAVSFLVAKAVTGHAY